tara:strand:- start:571 stop:813 length:243 start_codon:yes stop_codon:yes gene_type:complete
MIKKYGKYGKYLKLHYSYWRWYMECFFDDLHDPDLIAPTDCGVCFVCVSNVVPTCIFPQEPGTYKDWHEGKKAKYLRGGG